MLEETKPAGFYEVCLNQPACAPAPLLDPAATEWRNGLLVRAPNWLGDTLMTLPAVYKLSRFVPEPCGTFVLCPRALMPIWQAAPWVSHVIPLDGRRAGRKASEQIRGVAPGVAAVLPNSFGSALDVFGKGIPLKIGRGGYGRGLLLSHRLPKWRKGEGVGQYHQLTHYLQLAAAFGKISWDCECPPLRLEDAREQAQSLGVSPDDTTWLAMAPGAAYGPAKQWPADRFRAVAEWWIGKGGKVVIVGTPKEVTVGQVIAEGVEGCLNLTGKTTLTQLMALLSVVAAVVANDSGPMHLAAGLGTDGVAIFGSTDPVATGPIGARWVVLQEKTDCAPCFKRTCQREQEPYLCLTRISAEAACRGLESLALI